MTLSKQVGVRMPQNMIDAIDKLAEEKRRTRADMIRLLAEDWLIRHGRLPGDRSPLDD